MIAAHGLREGLIASCLALWREPGAATSRPTRMLPRPAGRCQRGALYVAGGSHTKAWTIVATPQTKSRCEAIGAIWWVDQSLR